MTLDPIHVDAIARLAGSVADSVDDSDHDDFAETVWTEWLDPLTDGRGRTVVEPLGEQQRARVDIDDIALAERPFPTVHGIDSGTINPTSFKNGVVLDLAHAAMAVDPSELSVHRARTIVATVHTNDRTASLESDWVSMDGGHSQRRLIRAPQVNRYAEAVVHALSLYLAEGHHARKHAHTVEDFLLLDGPLYPKEILTWRDRNPELDALTYEARPKSVLENYVRLVERFVEEKTPIAGFVKNPSARVITDALTENDTGFDAPWPNDTTFFTRLLEQQADEAQPDVEPEPGENRRTDELTVTSWFISRGGPDGAMAADGDALGVERKLDPECYEVTFFVLYDPRTDLCYKVESPYAVTRDPEMRQRLQTQILSEVAAERGPPTAVNKADELAKISASEKAAIRRKFESILHSEQQSTHDKRRWGEEY
ncbi:DNA double-strand break repair nuclease NurA [Halonotius terrestris]|uniref:DNA double-strand break repair nuclease NurA n=1 Tax=Halonotius terrestris TaxID=2487750 RepID=A0A8J8PBF3_9EURY|nr:DNA double-strand break repair nuclease NurA [Halonotius terrestris]TQQ80922.1 DNA double-strand break repair nuclease NurA [Halonotius terrestris]